MLQVTLANGLRVFLLEDHEVPVVHGTVLMRGGQRASPGDQVGMLWPCLVCTFIACPSALFSVGALTC